MYWHKRDLWKVFIITIASLVGIVGELLLACFSSVTVYAHTPALKEPPSPSPDAYLGLIGAITAAIITGLFVVYQVKQARKISKLELANQEMQRRLDRAQSREQFEDEIEKIRYGELLAARRAVQEQERERRKSARQAARGVMMQAKTPAEREAAYRRAIHADADITQLQVLDMAHPLEVSKVYVHLSLSREAKYPFEVDPALRQVELLRDPNALLRARHALTEAHVQQAMTPEKALQQYPRCIVLGDPGAGKSTLLKYLMLQAIDGKLPQMSGLPIHIVLGEFAASPDQDLIGFAARRWDGRYGFPEEEARTTIEDHLTDGRVLLLLDALDETVIGGSDEAARESYSRVLAAIDQLATRYPQAPIVVTARKAGYYRRAHLRGFAELEVLDFRPEEITRFIENWFQYHPTPSKYATASDLNTQLVRNPRIQALAANPLLLCLIVLVYESRQDLPEQRSRLYEQCVETLLTRWDTSRDIRRRKKFDAEKKLQLLEEIAWHFHVQGRRYFPENEVLEVTASFLPTVGLLAEESRAILSEIEEENGLLKEQAHGWHGFLHLTLQEYFVARYLCQKSNGVAMVSRHCGDTWWEEVIMLYASSVRDASPLLRAFLWQERSNALLFWRDHPGYATWWDRLWEKRQHTPLVWAGQCLAAKARIEQKNLRNTVVTYLFRVLSEKQSYYLDNKYNLAVKSLMEIGDSDTRGRVLSLLSDKRNKNQVRERVVEALGVMGDRSVIGELLAILKDKQDNQGVRAEVARALRALGDHSVIAELLAILKDKQDNEGVRAAVAGALGALGDHSAIAELLAILKDKQDHDWVRAAVAGALGALGDRSVIGELLAILKDKQDDEGVRAAVARALGAQGDRSIVGELLAILKDKQDHDWVRISVAQALEDLGDRSIVGELLAILKDKQDHDQVRLATVQALIRLGDRSIVGELLAVHNDRRTSRDLRRSIERALRVLR